MSRRNPPALALMASLVLSLPSAPARAEGLTSATLMDRLKALPSGAEASKLADEVRAWFGGKEKLAKGPNPKVDGTVVAWAIEVPKPANPPKVVSDDGKVTMELTRLGDTDVYAHAANLTDGSAMRWDFVVDLKHLPHPVTGPRHRPGPAQLEVYSEPADGREKPGVPRGKLIPQAKFRSKIFDGTSRDWWVYVPAQYSADAPAAVMVFQDGGGYKEFVPTVFDNLIAAKAMPVTVAVFVNPGTFDGGRLNRSFEYDTLSDSYDRFLLEELLPEVEKTVKLRHDAAGRAVAGTSSGGICAWTAAWERPGEFSKVLSWVGSFTNIASGKTGHEGGHNYEAMIRKTDKKPIRVFLQDGANDLDNAHGNWPLANQQMARSLASARYDYRFVYGNGFHSNRHGRAVLPDSLRWLWQSWDSELPKR